MTLVASARMYAVAPAAEAAWAALFAAVAGRSGVPLQVVAHAWPAPLDALWDRADLGCAFMCGLPYGRRLLDGGAPRPVAAPVPVASGGPAYWTDLVVRVDSPAQSAADLDGARAGYTATGSQSGFVAVRRFLRGLPEGGRPRFAALVGPLTTPRRALEALLAGRCDVAPLDSYAHALLALHAPDLARQVRVVARTPATPVPLLVASRGTDDAVVARLRAALTGLDDASKLAPLALQGFAVPPPDAAYAGLAEAADADAGWPGFLPAAQASPSEA